MISVATLTYKRLDLLEEAVHSFLLQEQYDCEMVILNDDCNARYSFDHNNIRIVNVNNRFGSIGEKLKYCFDLCRHDYIYRLDDDDLLLENALLTVKQEIIDHPGFDVYRSLSNVYMSNNRAPAKSSSVNNGNTYSKTYINRIPSWKKSCNEDHYITFENNATIHQFQQPTMIYRWGMDTYHISGIFNLDRPHADYLNIADKLGDSNRDKLILQPNFNSDYYELIRKGIE
jgi:glycosyltransferase involved in cell wall biosynthesis